MRVLIPVGEGDFTLRVSNELLSNFFFFLNHGNLEPDCLGSNLDFSVTSCVTLSQLLNREPQCPPPWNGHQSACLTGLLLLLLLSRFSLVWLCATPEMAAHQAPPSLRFSRQEHWSELPFPPPMHESEKWKWSHSVVSDPHRPHGLQPSRLLHPWDFPGKSTGVGCHYLLHIIRSIVPFQMSKWRLYWG